MNPENWKNAAFSQQKCPISFPLTQSKSCPDPKFWSALHSGSNPNSTRFAIVWIQSTPIQVQSISAADPHSHAAEFRKVDSDKSESSENKQLSRS